MSRRGALAAALCCASLVASLVTSLVVPAVASADSLVYGPGDLQYPFVLDTRSDGLVLARQALPASTTPTVESATTAVAFAQSRVIYLNKNGVTLSPGYNDSRTNHSTIVSQQTAIAGWNVSATDWADTVACMRELFGRFDATVVDTDPGNVPHIEAVFGGTPQQVGLSSGVAGVSPFTADCSIIENSVVFTFTNAYTFTSRQACEIMAQEVAHSFGLDHELLASDPMTYLPYNGNRSFQDVAAQCGENQARPCGISGSVCRSTQNSVQLLTERLGLADSIKPSIVSMAPAAGATVPPGFAVKVTGSDNLAVAGAVLKIDGMQVDAQTGAGPFTFATPTSLSDGAHTISVDVSDGKNITTETRDVTVSVGAPPPNDPSGSGSGGEGQSGEDTYGQVMGGCAAGTGTAGNLWALGIVGALVGRRRRRRS